MHAARSASCAVLGLLCGGCFLEDLKVSCVDSRTNCHALNVANKIAEDACEVYQCRADSRGCELRERDYDGDTFLDPQSCSDRDPKRLDCNDDPDGGKEFHPDADELCDGVDNNCNGDIDENQLSMDKVRPAVPRLVRGVEFASYSVDHGALSVALFSQTSRTATWQVGDSNVTGSDLLPVSETCSYIGPCEFSQLSVAANSSVLLALGVDVRHCIDGFLRVSARKAAAMAPLSFWPMDSLEIDTDVSCGTNGRGAHAPRLALLTGTESREQSALGSFRAGSIIAVSPAPIALFGLRVTTTTERIEVARVGKTHLDGESTRGYDAASLAAWSGSTPGYFIAFDSELGVEVAFAPAPTSSTWEPAGTMRTRITGDPSVRHVSLAVDASAPPSASVRGLAAAWRARIRGRDHIRFVSLAFAPGNAVPFARVGDVISLREVSQIVDGPALVYRSHGFREGDTEPGGWFAAWVEGAGGGGQRLVGVRVAEHTGQPFEKPFILAEHSGITQLTVYEGSSSLGYAFISQSNQQQLNIGSLQCGAPQ